MTSLKLRWPMPCLVSLSFVFAGLAVRAIAASPQLAAVAEAANSPGSSKSLPVPSTLKLAPMNGIDPSVADQYWEKWHLVTSRYRIDNNQTRIVYANELAWQAMVNRRARYPDGAIFAKAIFLSEKDPTFPVSLVPKQYQMLELMKKDTSAYPGTHGWGYAIYNYNSDLSSPPPVPADRAHELMVSCAGCHNIIQERDFVFSQPAFLQWYRNDPHADLPIFAELFKETAVDKLPEFAKKFVRSGLPSSYETYKVYSLPALVVGEHLALPSLAEFTRADGIPHILVTSDQATLLLTLPPLKKLGCVRYFMTLSGSTQIQRGEMCDGNRMVPAAAQ